MSVLRDFREQESPSNNWFAVGTHPAKGRAYPRIRSDVNAVVAAVAVAVAAVAAIC